MPLASLLRASLGALGLMAGGAAPPQSDCRLALALAVDISRSIDSQDYIIQTEGLALALEDPEVRRAIFAPEGEVVLAIYYWSGRGYQDLVQQKLAERPALEFGLRINPEHSEGAVAMYDPCAPGSRLGTPVSQLNGQDLSGFSGLHFHTLCEQNFAPLARTLDAVERHCADLLHQVKWVNFGGGHHITHPDYDVAGLIARIREFSARYQVQVYLEPGEAIAIRSGILVSEVLDVMSNSRSIAILDSSATCHMPDTLEMPYRAYIKGSGEAGAHAHTYRLGGLSCLAGDVMGDYSFAEPLQVGQRLIFDDMAHYTMVKTTTFNGVRLPAIAIWNSLTNNLRIVREFGYQDFRNRLS